MFGITLALLLLVVLLVIFVPPRQNKGMAVEAAWVNLTAFPALPTGISTVIQPSTAKADSGCVSSPSLWSCDVPASSSNTYGIEDQSPNFRFEIQFRNGTLPNNETQLAKRSRSPALAGAIVRRDSWTSYLYKAQPQAPSKDDQLFLGQYTDNNDQPFNGETTPFSLSLLDPRELQATSSIRKRQSDPYPYPTGSTANTKSSSNATTEAGKNIPRPALKPNGEPQNTTLFPFVKAQPLRLYNRGQPNEHYGFYSYYDRSIFATSALEGSARTSSVNNASAVCTWSQTRMHVQIWTRKPAVATLDDPVPLRGLPAVNSTANDMVAPGSSPYRVTVTLDRHGGKAKEKGVYCYGLDERHRVLDSVKTWVDEDRSAGAGQLVNAAAVPHSSNATSLQQRDPLSYGGIDGGSGGCVCQWESGN